MKALLTLAPPNAAPKQIACDLNLMLERDASGRLLFGFYTSDGVTAVAYIPADVEEDLFHDLADAVIACAASSARRRPSTRHAAASF